jgi:hypothetical protein
MLFQVKFTEDHTRYEMNWDHMIPNIEKRGGINILLNKEKDMLTYQMESIHEFEAADAEQALRMANQKKLDWAGVKSISKIELVGCVEPEIVEVVKVDESSKIITAFSLSNTYNFAQILEKMIAEDATHVVTDLTSMYNFIYDFDLVEKLAKKIPTKKQPLKVLNGADAEEMKYIAAHTDAEEVEIKEFGNSIKINLNDYR